MTRDDIMRLAREAEIFLPLWEDELDPYVDPPYAHTMLVIPPLLERFAALVAAAEREACLKAFRDLQNGRDDPINGDDWDQGWSAGWHSGVFDCKDVIRARGEP